MCGIIYAHKPSGNVSKTVRKRYVAQAARGKQGYGFLPVSNNRLQKVQRAKWEKDSLAQLKETNVNEILYHHRHPTSTENLINTTHPFVIKHEDFEYDYYIVHNGVITSTHADRVRHEKMGINYSTLHEKKEVSHFPNLGVSEEELVNTKHNDSESLAWDVALFLEGKADDLPFVGAAALIGIQATKSGRKKGVFFGHNAGRPLIEEIHKGKNGPLYILKSEGKGGSVVEDKLFFRDNKGDLSSWNVDIGTYHVPRTMPGAPMGYGANPPQRNVHSPYQPHTSNKVHRLPSPSDFNETSIDEYMENVSEELNKRWDSINDRLADINYEVNGWNDEIRATVDPAEKDCIREEIRALKNEERKLNNELDMLLESDPTQLEVIT